MVKKKCDYKGKWFILQDTIDEDDWMDVEIGEMDDPEITDEFLEEHVNTCIYYGIPAYIGNDKELKERINNLHIKYENDNN
jgi:hypothetical protein